MPVPLRSQKLRMCILWGNEVDQTEALKLWNGGDVWSYKILTSLQSTRGISYCTALDELCAIHNVALRSSS